jgi:hypothetical protein
LREAATAAAREGMLNAPQIDGEKTSTFLSARFDSVGKRDFNKFA